MFPRKMQNMTLSGKAIGKSILLAGAGCGFCKTLADSLARDGWNIATCSRRMYREADSLSKPFYPEQKFHVGFCDLRDESAVAQFVESASRNVGFPEVVVCCAGPISYHSEVIPDASEWLRMFQGNVLTTVNVLRAVIPGLKNSRSGRVILMGFSGTGSGQAFKTIVPYAAMKESLFVLMRSLAKDMASFNVTVNLLSPGVIVPEHAKPTPAEKRLLKKIPLGSFGTEADIIKTVQWLISPAAQYVSGQNIKVSGGLHI